MIGKRRLFILDCAEDSSGPIGRADAAAFGGYNVKRVNLSWILSGDAFVPGIKGIAQPRATIGLCWCHRPEVVVVVSQAAIHNPDRQQNQHGQLHEMPEIDQAAAPKNPRGSSDDQDCARSHFTRENDGVNDQEQPEDHRHHRHRRNDHPALPPELLIELSFRLRRATHIPVGSHFRRSQKQK